MDFYLEQAFFVTKNKLFDCSKIVIIVKDCMEKNKAKKSFRSGNFFVLSIISSQELSQIESDFCCFYFLEGFNFKGCIGYYCFEAGNSLFDERFFFLLHIRENFFWCNVKEQLNAVFHLQISFGGFFQDSFFFLGGKRINFS